MINNRPKLSDSNHSNSWWHQMYTDKEKETLQKCFSGIMEILLGKQEYEIDSSGEQFMSSDSYSRLVGLSIQEGIYLVETLGFKAHVEVIPKPKPPVPGQGQYDLVGGSFACQSRFVGYITLYVKEGDSTICRVKYG